MKTYGGVVVLLHAFLTLVLDGSKLKLHALAPLPPWIEPWVPI
jgi:hypothetical protein